MKEKWTTSNAPVPSRCIAQVSLDRNIGIGYISGLVSQKPDGTVIADAPVTEQTRIILENMKAILTDLGLTMENVIKTNIFLRDMDDFNAMHEVYCEFFTDENPPARQCVQSGIWNNLAIEISAEITLK